VGLISDIVHTFLIAKSELDPQSTEVDLLLTQRALSEEISVEYSTSYMSAPSNRAKALKQDNLLKSS
jgi:hypothetical protein